MPAPAAFIPITVIPFSRLVTQAEFNGGTFGNVPNEVWFQFITATKVALGNFTNHGGTFGPIVRLFASDGSTLLKQVNFSGGMSHGFWYITVPGTYYIRITRSGGGASNFDFTVQFDTRPTDTDVTVLAGDLLVNDDSVGFAATVFRPSTGALIGFITTIPGGEIGSILADNTQIWHDPGNSDLKIISPTFSIVASVDTIPGINGFQPLTSNTATEFYICNPSDGTIWRCTSIGVMTQIATITLPSADDPSAIGVNAAGTILYWTEQDGNASIHRHNLSTDTPMSDLYTIPGYDLVNDTVCTTPNGNPGDILVLPDNSVVLFWNDTSAAQFIILHIDSAGTLLHTITYNSPLSLDHLAYIKNSTTSVIVWLYTNIQLNIGRYAQLDLATGTLSPSADTDHFTTGDNLIGDDPVMFGPSQSCTVLRYQEVVIPPAPPNPSSGIYKIVPGKHNDTLWDDLSLLTTFNVKIP